MIIASSLARHRRTHHKDTPHPCDHTGCKLLFVNRKELNKHKLQHNADDIAYYPNLNYRSALPEQLTSLNNDRKLPVNTINDHKQTYQLISPFPNDAFNGTEKYYTNNTNRSNNGLSTPCETPNMSPVQQMGFHLNNFRTFVSPV